MVESLHWDEALEACRGLTALLNVDEQYDLTSVLSLEQMEFLRTEFVKDSQVWIGLKRVASLNEFTWSDGSDLDYVDWAAGYPNFSVRYKMLLEDTTRYAFGKHYVL